MTSGVIEVDGYTISPASPELWEVKIIEPLVFDDPRGNFRVPFSEDMMKAVSLDPHVSQINESQSRVHVLRGLHLQRGPFAQGKLIRVTHGTVLDVAVDVRHGSPTFGRHITIELSRANRRVFFVPEGFAHGFYVVPCPENSGNDLTDFEYVVNRCWDKDSELSIRWDSAEVDWGQMGGDPILSDPDASAPRLKDIPVDNLPVYTGPLP